MLLTYVDESYTDDWFIMAALLVDGPAAVALTQELNRVARRAAIAYGLEVDPELHGYEIFHGSGSWGDVPVRARVGVFDDVVEAVASHDVRVILRAMDRVGQRERYGYVEPAHEVVLSHLLERIDECVMGLGEYALVIADEVDTEARHRADLSSYRQFGTVGYRTSKLTRIVDTLHFAPSSDSRLFRHQMCSPSCTAGSIPFRRPTNGPERQSWLCGPGLSLGSITKTAGSRRWAARRPCGRGTSGRCTKGPR